LGVLDPGLSPMTDSGELRSRPGAEDAIWLQRLSSSSRSRNQFAAPLEMPMNVKGGGMVATGKNRASCEESRSRRFFLSGKDAEATGDQIF
jgi:hypothetical protein